MKTLGGRITLLLVVAIVTVVGLATLAASLALRGPRPQATMVPVAMQIQTLASLVENTPRRAEELGATIAATPVTGEAEEGLSRFLQAALRRNGPAREAVVVRLPRQGWLTASVALSDGRYLVTSIPDFGPPSGNWRALASWIVLIVIGSAAVAVFAARKITRPLTLIENAVSTIGPDGVPAQIPETGSGEVRATAQALNRLSARLRTAMESRMRLVAAAGHDLRTPMTRMRLRAEFLPDEERERWLNDLEELDRIADSAIRLVREEVDADQIQSVDLDRLVREIVAELSQQGLSLDYASAGRFVVRGGTLALTRAMRNLLINAATHGRKAQVRLHRDGTFASVEIADEGPGIPEEMLSRVFEPFFRVDIARRKSLPGAGLGLAIAREIIERFGGTIAIANRPEGGLIQTVRLPLAG